MSAPPGGGAFDELFAKRFGLAAEVGEEAQLEQESREALGETIAPGRRAPAVGGFPGSDDDYFNNRLRTMIEDRLPVGPVDTTPGALQTPEGQRAAAEMTVSTAVGYLTGGWSLLPRVAAQVATVAPADFVTRLAQGEEAEAAARGAAMEGGIAGTAEAVAPVPGKVVGGLIRYGRRAVRATAQAIRRAGGRPGRMNVPRMQSSRAPFREFLEEGGEEAVETTLELGGVVIPGQVVENEIVDRAGRFAESSIFPSTTQRLRSTEAATEALIRGRIDEVVASMPDMPRERAAALVQAIVDGRIAQVKGIAQGHYRMADVLMEGAEGIDLRPLKAEAKRYVERASKGLIAPDARLERILQMDDSVGFEAAQTVRSDLFEISQQFNPNSDPVLTRAKGAAKHLATVLTRSINSAAKSAGPAAEHALREGNRMWAEEMKGTLTHKIVQKILKRDGEEVVDALIRNGKPGAIRRFRKIIEGSDNPEAWEVIQGSMMRRILFDAVDEQGRVQGGKLLRAVQRFGKEDRAALEAMFPTGGQGRHVLDEIEALANALMFAQRRASAGTQAGAGAIALNFLQAGALVGGATAAMEFALTGEFDATAAGLGAAAGGTLVLLAPTAFSRILTHPTMSRWLTVGLQQTPGSRLASRSTLLLLRWLKDEELLATMEDVDKADFLIRQLDPDSDTGAQGGGRPGDQGASGPPAGAPPPVTLGEEETTP